MAAMCGRFTLRTPARAFADEFGLSAVPDLRPRYNIAPTQEVAVVRLNPSGGRELAMLRWGDDWLSRGEPPLLLTHMDCNKDFKPLVAWGRGGPPPRPPCPPA